MFAIANMQYQLSAGTEYVNNIWAARYFWSHLALSDLRSLFRRSSIGMLWAVLNPLFHTLLLSLIMGQLFQQEIGDFAPFVFSGTIVWEYLTTSANAGCRTFINAEGYIKQFRQPLAIYPLRNVVANIIVFILALSGLILWVILWKPSNFGWSWLSLVLVIPIYIFFAWPIAIVFGFINVRMRDFVHLVGLLIQALWFASPVFIRPEFFMKAGMWFLVTINPVYHLLNLLRAPLLTGSFPCLINYFAVLVTAAAFWLFAVFLIIKQEKNLVFYL